jgi:alcohol dehydrogenase
MIITGAVLEEVGRPGPWAETRPLTVGELELEGPHAGEVLVQVEAAGVCHSDRSSTATDLVPSPCCSATRRAVA